MADQQRLKDARIEVQIDTSAAERALDDLTPGGGPGQRPPEPGRDAEKDRRRDDERPPRDGQPSVVAGVGKIPRAVVTLVRTMIAATVARQILEIVPGYIDKQLEQIPPGGLLGTGAMEAFMERRVGEMVRDAMKGGAATGHALEAAAATIPAAVGTAVDVARAQAALRGEVDIPGVGRLALQQAQLASIEAAQRARARQLGRNAAGAAIADLTNQFMEAAIR